MTTLEGKVALVTGAGSGIGRATAESLARAGADTVLTDVNDDAGGEVAARLRTEGLSARYLHLDVSHESDWAAVFAVLRADSGRLHILVNNAGIAWAGSILDMTLEDWRRQNAVNLDGVFLGTRFAVPFITESGGGSIVNLSSVAGLRGSARLAGYGATKGGVRLLTKSVALECAENGWPVRVNSVHPGIIATPIWDGMTFADGTNWHDPHLLAAEGVPGGKAGTPDQVARAILFLASDESAYVNGSELVVDAGLTA